jgi:hypothetical protein
MTLQATPVRADFHPIVAVEPSGYGAFPGAFNLAAFRLTHYPVLRAVAPTPVIG